MGEVWIFGAMVCHQPKRLNVTLASCGRSDFGPQVRDDARFGSKLEHLRRRQPRPRRSPCGNECRMRDDNRVAGNRERI